VAGLAAGAVVTTEVESFTVESVLVEVEELLPPELQENNIMIPIAGNDKNLHCFICEDFKFLKIKRKKKNSLRRDRV
jgi:hypothetical protein